MRTLAAVLLLSLSGCSVALDVPREGCLSGRPYTRYVHNPYRSAPLGEINGTAAYVGDRPSSAAEQRELLLGDPATRADEEAAQREQRVAMGFGTLSTALANADLVSVSPQVARGWNEGRVIWTASAGATAVLGGVLTYVISRASKKHAERAFRVFNAQAAATGSCPPPEARDTDPTLK